MRLDRSGPAVDPYDAQRGLAAVLERLGLDPCERPRAGRYEVRRVIGVGGFGRVYQAWDPHLERSVAIKAIHIPHAHADTLRRAARAEARALASLSHPNVVQIFDVLALPSSLSPGAWDVMIVMELVEGETLSDWIARAAPSWREVAAAYAQAAEGLAAAHGEGIVHRDFKPANAMRDANGRVVVLDFGVAAIKGRVAEALARSVDGSAVQDLWSAPMTLDVSAGQIIATTTGRGVIVGTPAYMAPEQHRGEEPTEAADLYALAASLYEGLHGRRAFEGASAQAVYRAKRKTAPPRINREVPSHVQAAILRALAAHPPARWDSTRAFADAIRPRRRTARVALPAAAGLLAGAAGLLTHTELATPCYDAASAFTRSWEARRARVAGLQEERGTSAPGRSAYAAALDAYAERWRKSYNSGCAREIGLMRECLDDAGQTTLAAIDAAVAGRTAPPRPDELPDVEACGDDELVRRDRLPADPTARRQLRTLQQWAAAAPSTPFLLPAEAKSHIDLARRLGHGPTTARVLRAVGIRFRDARDFAAMASYMRPAYEAAIEGGADRLAMVAATDMVLAAETLDESERWSNAAVALADRLRNTDRIRAVAHTYHSFQLHDAGRVGAAWDRIQLATDYATAQPDTDWFALVVLVRAVNYAVEHDRLVEARDHAEEVERRRASATDASLRLDAVIQVALLHRYDGELERAAALFAEATGDTTANPETRWVAQANLAEVFADLGRIEQAERVLDTATPNASMFGTQPDSAFAVDLAAGGLAITRAYIRTASCRVQEAEALLDEALRLFERHLPHQHTRFRLLETRRRAVRAAKCPDPQ